jgi:hypothetical protein
MRRAARDEFDAMVQTTDIDERARLAKQWVQDHVRILHGSYTLRNVDMMDLKKEEVVDYVVKRLYQGVADKLHENMAGERETRHEPLGQTEIVSVTAVI